MLNKLRNNGEKYNFTITVHSLRLSTSMPWHSTKTWYHDKARECSEIPEWASQVGVVWKRGNKDARTRWESTIKIDADDPVKVDLITWDQSLSLPFTVYPKGHSQFKEKMCSIQLYARTGHSSDAMGKKLASCKVDLGSVVPSKTVDLELLMDSKPLGLLRLSFTAKHAEFGSPASPQHSTQTPFSQNKGFSSSFTSSATTVAAHSDQPVATPPNASTDRVINNGRKGGMLRQVASWSGGRKVPESVRAISREETPEVSSSSGEEEESRDRSMSLSREVSRDGMTPTPSVGRTPTKAPPFSGGRRAATASVSRSAPVSPRGGAGAGGHVRMGSMGAGSFTPSTDYQGPKVRMSADYAEKRRGGGGAGAGADEAEALTPLRKWEYSRVGVGGGSRSFNSTPVTRSAAGSRTGSRAASPGPRELGTVEEPEEDCDVSTHNAGGDAGGASPSKRRLDAPPAAVTVERSQSDMSQGKLEPRKSVDVAASRSIFTSIGDTFSSSFSVLGLGGRKASVAETSASASEREDSARSTRREQRDKWEDSLRVQRDKDTLDKQEASMLEAGESGTPFAKTNSELLKEVFALRRQAAAQRTAMEERDREIAELRDSEADLKLRLVRAEAFQKLPSAHSTSTNTQKLIAEEAERLTSVYVPLLRELSDEVETLKLQLAESRAELSKTCNGNHKNLKRR